VFKKSINTFSKLPILFLKERSKHVRVLAVCNTKKKNNVDDNNNR
jgi:hypothetical protein